jgi:pilus assembly protein CpaF
MCTIHANSAQDAVTKLCTLPLLAGANISSAFVVPTVAACIDIVVHCSRRADGRRHVTEILSLGQRVENGVIETSSIFAVDGDGILRARSTGLPAVEKFSRAGIDVLGLLEGV